MTSELRDSLKPAEKILFDLHNELHNGKPCTQGNCHRRDSASRLVGTVLATTAEAVATVADKLEACGYDEAAHAIRNGNLG